MLSVRADISRRGMEALGHHRSVRVFFPTTTKQTLPVSVADFLNLFKRKSRYSRVQENTPQN